MNSFPDINNAEECVGRFVLKNEASSPGDPRKN